MTMWSGGPSVASPSLLLPLIMLLFTSSCSSLPVASTTEELPTPSLQVEEIHLTAGSNKGHDSFLASNDSHRKQVKPSSLFTPITSDIYRVIRSELQQTPVAAAASSSTTEDGGGSSSNNTATTTPTTTLSPLTTTSVTNITVFSKQQQTRDPKKRIKSTPKSVAAAAAGEVVDHSTTSLVDTKSVASAVAADNRVNGGGGSGSRVAVETASVTTTAVAGLPWSITSQSPDDTATWSLSKASTTTVVTNTRIGVTQEPHARVGAGSTTLSQHNYHDDAQENDTLTLSNEFQDLLLAAESAETNSSDTAIPVFSIVGNRSDENTKTSDKDDDDENLLVITTEPYNDDILHPDTVSVITAADTPANSSDYDDFNFNGVVVAVTTVTDENITAVIILDTTQKGVRVRDIVIGVCGTVAAFLLLCMLFTFSRCCCQNKKGSKDGGSDTEDELGDEAEQYGFSRPGRGHAPPPASLRRDPQLSQVVTVETEPRLGDARPRAAAGDPGCEGEGGGLTVAQRIRAFEKSKLGAGGKEVRLRGDGSKPRRKKPQSKAFEEFESTGVIIGFGKKPRPKTDPTCGSGDGAADDQYEPDREEEEEEEDSMGSLDYKASSLSKSQESDRSISISQASSTRLTEDEGIHTMDSEDDEFAAVARNSEVLKSFRRAPPPKNRTKARRSIRQRAHLKEEAEVNDFFRSMGLDEIDNEDGQSSPSILKKSKSQPVSLQSAKERRIQFDTQQSHPAAAIGRASPKQARDSPKPNKSSSNLKSSSNVLKTPSDSAVAPKDEAGPATTKKCDNSSSTNDSNTNKESGGGSNRLDSDTKDSQPTKQQPLNKHNVFLDWVPAWKDSSSSASKERAQVHRQWPPPRDGSHPARGSNPAIDALGLGLGRLGSRAEDVKPKGPWGGAAAPGHAKISSRVDFYNKEPCNQAERDAKLDRLRRPLSYHYSHEDSRKDSTGYESEASIHYSNDGGYNFYTRNPLQSATRSASEQQAGVAVAEPAASKPWQQELAASGRGGKRLTKQIEELSNFASSSDKQQPSRSAWYQVGDEDDCPAPPQRPPPRLPPARSNRHSYHPSSTGASSSSSPSSPYSPLLHHHHQATSPLIYPASSQHHHPPRPQLHHSQSYTQQSQSAADLHDDDAPHQSYRPVYTDRYGYGPLPTHDRYSYYSQSSHLSYDCDNELSPMSSSDSHSYGGYYGGGGGGSGLSPGGGDHSPSYQYPRVQSPRGSQYQGYNPLPSHDPSYSPGSPVTSSSHGGSVGHLSPADTSTAFSTTYSLTQRSREEIPLEYRGSTPRLDSRGSSDPHTPSSSSIEFHIEQDGTPV